MSDEENMPAWRKKFLATRMAMESILFERELSQPKKESLVKGLLVLGAIWLLHALLLAQWAMRRGYFFNQADSESFGAVLRYAAYLKTDGFWALVKPEFADLTLNPPLYYLAYVPVLNYLTPDLNLALILVNSFFLLVLALAVFLTVRDNRPNAAGWLGAAFALAFPFVLETARRPAPEMALLAFAAAMYACYVRSKELNHPHWTLAFALCLGLGFYSHRAFWLYALPLLPFIIAGLANPNGRDELIKGFFPAMLVNLPWYLFAIAVAATGLVPLLGEYNGFWHYFRLGASSAGLPLFTIGAAALAWLYFAVFMPLDNRKVLAAWFWAPYLLLTWLLRGSRPELLYPAMLPFAIGVAVMTPHQVRKYLLIFVLALGALNQSGYVRPFPEGGKYPLAGLPPPAADDFRAREMLSLVAANTPGAGGLVGVYGDSNINAAGLRFAAGTGKVKFADSPACPSCPFMLLHKTPRFGEPDSAAEKSFAALRGGEWFTAIFDKKAELPLPDTSKVEVYVKTPSTMKFLEEGAHTVRNLRLGPLTIAEATLRLSGFDPETGVYARAFLFAPSAELSGGDIYGLDLAITGLSLGGPSLNPPLLTGLKSVTVRSASITDYAVERFLSGRYPFLKDLEVSLDEGMALTAVTRGRRLEATFALSVRDGGVLEARPVHFALGRLVLTPYLLRLFSYKLDFRDNPYNVKVSGLHVSRSLIVLN